MYPADLKYTKDHEWIRTAAGAAEVGITDYAQQQLGDVVFVELPDVGRGTIESVKAVSELFSPVAGEVVAVNTNLQQQPEKINEDPHGTWIIRVNVKDAGELDALLPADQYSALVKS
jgi:glycine cleavage system H protein